MSEYSNNLSEDWQTIWMKALTEPSVETFEEIIQDPSNKLQRASTWVFIAYTIAFLLNIISRLIFGTPSYASSSAAEPNVGAFVCCIPFIGIIGVIGFLISTAIIWVIARIIGGSGNFEDHALAVASYSAPVALISAVANLIPYVGLCVSALLGLYILVVSVIAVKAVHKFGWIQAIIAQYGLFFLIVCGFILFFVFLSSSTDNTFQNIIDQLVTPTPRFR